MSTPANLPKYDKLRPGPTFPIPIDQKRHLRPIEKGGWRVEGGGGGVGGLFVVGTPGSGRGGGKTTPKQTFQGATDEGNLLAPKSREANFGREW